MSAVLVVASRLAIVEFKSSNLGMLSERFRFSVSWEPLGGSPEHPQLGPEIGGSGEATRWLPPDTSVARRWLANDQKYRLFLNFTIRVVMRML